MELKNLDLDELTKLRYDCSKLIHENKENEKEKILEDYKNTISNMTISDRVRKFYETYNIDAFDFLYKSINHCAGNNMKELDTYSLLTHDKDAVRMLRSINIRSSFEFNQRIISTGKFPGRDDINNKIAETKKLIYLYNYFLDINSIINHQGSFNTFKYITDTLNRVLIDSEKSDEELINVDWEKKVIYLAEHLIEVANYLLEYRDSIPNARLSVCNQSLGRIANKTGSEITQNEKLLIRALAFGTTLEKLEDENYEDGKNLIYVPYKK